MVTRYATGAADGRGASTDRINGKMHNYHLGNEASAKAWLMQKVNDKISTYVFTDSMMSIYTQKLK